MPALPLLFLLAPACLFHDTPESEPGAEPAPTPEPDCTMSLTVSPQSITFAVGEGGSDRAVPVLLTASDCEVVTIDRVAVDDADAPFKVGALGAVILPPGATTSFFVTYEPNGLGVTEGVAEVSYGGLAEPATIALHAPSGDLVFEPELAELADLEVGCDAEGGYLLRNTSLDTVLVDDVAWSSSSGELTVDLLEARNGPLPWTLAGGDQAAVRVAYEPIDDTDDDLTLTASLEGQAWNAASATFTATATWAEEVVLTWTAPFPATPDVLLVVDDSASMAEEAAGIPGQVEWIVEALEAAGLSAHFAVITTREAELQGPVVLSGDLEAAETLAAQSEVGTEGAGDSMGLTTAWQALQPSGEAGPGSAFLREDSSLHVVFIVDGPDLGSVPWADFVVYGQSLRTDAADFLVHAITGDAPSGCATAAPGLDYIDAATASGGTFASICSTNWGETVADALIGEPFNAARYELEGVPVSVSIEVYVDGERIDEGWSYSSGDNALEFTEEATPVPGSVVEIRYRPVPDCG